MLTKARVQITFRVASESKGRAQDSTTQASTSSAGGLWLPCSLRHPPIDAFQQHAELGRSECGGSVRRRGPNKAALLKPLREQAKPLPIPPQRLEEITAPTAEYQNLPTERIALEHLLDQHGQAVKALAHGGDARREPNPRSGRRRDHRPDNAVNTRRSGSISTSLPTPITTPLASRISMRAPMLVCEAVKQGVGAAASAIRTGTKPHSPTPSASAAASN